MRIAQKAILIAVGLGLPATQAMGSCLNTASPFRMEGETVTWSISVNAGQECVEGLRYSTMKISEVSIVVPPISGRLILSGPSFRYFASPDVHGADTFTLAVTGTNNGVAGSSTIKIDVTLP
jgi:hypothetical protein